MKRPKEENKLKYDDKIASEKLVASTTEAENKSIDFDDFSTPNSSTIVTDLSSPEFDIEFKENNDVNLFNDTHANS